VEREENEFKQDELKDKRVYYDINVTTNDPEEVRSRIANLLLSKGYKPVLNKLTKFEELSEFGDLFTGGKLKPIRGILKAKKTFREGRKFSKLSFILLLIGIGLLLFYFFIGVNSLTNDLINLYLSITGGIFVVSFLLLAYKEKITFTSWIKIIGIFDPSEKITNLRIVLTGDLSKPVEETIVKLEDDLSDIYGAIASKYVRRKSSLNLYRNIKIEEVRNQLKTLREKLDELNNKLISGEITEEVYNKIREDYNKFPDEMYSDEFVNCLNAELI